MGSCHRFATLARLRRKEHRLEEWVQVRQAAAEGGVARQFDQQVGADHQGADRHGRRGIRRCKRRVWCGRRRGGRGPPVCVGRYCARRACGSGRWPWRGPAAGAGPGAGTAARRGVGVAARIAVAKRAWLTLHGVLPTIWPRRAPRTGGGQCPTDRDTLAVSWRGEGPVWRTLPEHMGGMTLASYGRQCRVAIARQSVRHVDGCHDGVHHQHRRRARRRPRPIDHGDHDGDNCGRLALGDETSASIDGDITPSAVIPTKAGTQTRVVAFRGDDSRDRGSCIIRLLRLGLLRKGVRCAATIDVRARGVR